VKIIFAIAVIIAASGTSVEGARADDCPKDGKSAWCCGLQRPAAAPSPANYRWREKSELCEGLISPLQSASVLNLVGFIAEPVPSDKQLEASSGAIQVMLPKLPSAFEGPLRFRGMSLKGGRYFVAGEFAERRPKSWDISQFRANVSMLTFDFLAYRPADPTAGRPMVYMPVRLVLPGSQAAQGTASRIRLLSDQPLVDARATFIPLGPGLQPDQISSQRSLGTKVASSNLVEVTIPDGMPPAFRLLIRSCPNSEQNCDLAKAAPVTFDVVTAP